VPRETPVIPSLRGSTVVRVATVVGTAGLVWAAVRTGLEGQAPWLVVLDLAVGIAFVGAALLAPRSLRMRSLVALVGMAWLVGAVLPVASVAHQGALLVALLAFPAGRLRGAEAWIGPAAGLAVALLLVPQGVVALLFGGVALRWLLRRESVPATYPLASASGTGLVLGASWLARSLDPFAYDPAVALVAYAVVLLLVAIGFLPAMRGIEDRTSLRDRVLREEGLTGLHGLGVVLADALDDPSIVVVRWDAARGGYVDGRGEPVTIRPSLRLLPVMDGRERLGAIVHRSSALDDERTAAAVTDGARLALLNLRWQEALEEQLDELEVARARLLGAADEERAAVAARLQAHVIVRIGDAVAALRAADVDPSDSDAADAVEVALNELDAAGEELSRLVRGLGPARLGDGALVRLLRGVAARSPLPVEVTAETDAVGDATAETALYYACLEAMANTAKHAAANAIQLSIRRRGDMLEAVVSDDGVGGADPTGSGLQGLADRLAATGGRLRVESPPGAGTTVVAEVPASRSSATPAASGDVASDPRRR
jgi:signal transduction histidine kinase